MASSMPSICYEGCPDQYEWKVRCYSGGIYESLCPGVARKPCKYSSYNPYKYKVCTCVQGSYRRKDNKCVLFDECVPETDLSKEQQEEMAHARQLLYGMNILLLFYAVNGMAKLTQDTCWTSTKVKPWEGGIHHNMTYYENSLLSPQRPPTHESNGMALKLGKRDAVWHVKPKFGIPSIILEAFDGKKRDPDITGTFTIFAAQPACFVMGMVRKKDGAVFKKLETKPIRGPSDNSMCFYWINRTSLSKDRQKCEEAFHIMCSDIRGQWYNYKPNECNFSKSI